MCDILFLPDENQTEITSIRELVALWPEPVMHDGEALPDDLNQCICPVDLEATAEKYGRKLTTEDYTWFNLLPVNL